MAVLPTEAGPPGQPVVIDWPTVPGVPPTDLAVEVDTFPLSVSPVPAQVPIATLSVTQDGAGVVVTVPDDRATHSLTLTGLAWRPDGQSKHRPVVSAADLAGARLVVSLSGAAGGPFDPPRFAVTPVGARGMIPSTLTGASLTHTTAGPTVTFPPGIRARRIRLSVATGDVPEEFEERPTTVGSVTGTATAQPVDLAFIAPDGTTAWASPGELVAATAELRVSLEVALTAALATGSPPAATFTLVGAPGSRVRLAAGPARGTLVHRFPGVRTTVLTGAPTPPAGLTGLSTTEPSLVTGDLTVRYDGLRLLTDASDPTPPGPGGVTGPVVGTEPVTRPLPPSWPPPARVGIIGRSTVDTELSVSLLDIRGEPLGPSGHATVRPSREFHTVWVDVTATGTPATLSVRADTGTFRWAATDHPLARFAVADPDPAPVPLRLGSTILATVDGLGIHLPGTGLPPTAFAATPSMLDCPLFLHVDLSDLELRYAR